MALGNGRRGPRSLALVLGLASALGACAPEAMPSPLVAAEAHADALRRGDAGALEAMLRERDRRELGHAEIVRLLAENRAELKERGAALSRCRAAQGVPACRVESQASVVYADGSTVALVIEGSLFRLRGSGTLPAHPETPEAALAELRQSIERKSLVGLLALLSEERRRSLLADLDVLAEALGETDTTWIEVRGDAATAELPGGLRVRLRREAGAWRVEGIE